MNDLTKKKVTSRRTSIKEDVEKVVKKEVGEVEDRIKDFVCKQLENVNSHVDEAVDMGLAHVKRSKYSWAWMIFLGLLCMVFGAFIQAQFC